MATNVDKLVEAVELLVKTVANTNKGDHDLLISANTKLDGVDKNLTNHLEHHNKYFTLILSIMLTAIATALISVCFLISKLR